MTTYACPSGSPVCTQYGRPETSTTACTSASSSGTVASPNRRMPALSPSASRSACAEHDRGVLDGVVGVDVGVAARSATTRSTSACRANEVEHVVVEADAGRDVGAARAVEVDLDVDLGLLGLPVDRRGAGHRRLLQSRRRASAVSASLNAAISSARADRDPQPAVGPGLADQHAAVEQALPDGVPVGERRRTARSSRRCRPPRAPARAATRRSRRARRAGRRPGRAARRRAAAPRARRPG